jgi:thioredoxin-like negative regulator of GroEL
MSLKPQTSQKTDLSRLGNLASEHIQKGWFEDAERVCTDMQNADPNAPDPWVYRARIAQQKHDFNSALTHAKRALALSPERQDVRLVDAEMLMYCGQIAEAILALKGINQDARNDLATTKRLCALYTQLGRHEEAYGCALRVKAFDPEQINHLYLLASAAIAMGKIDEAETLLDKIVRKAPQEGDIYYNRAGLRKQTAERNHVRQIRESLGKTSKTDPRYAPLCYALGKELEDLGEQDEAFSCFANGAAARKARLSYRVADEVDAATHIVNTFSAQWWENTPAGDDAASPVFILGLPRSGTTLVDRITSAHSQVSSLGEVNDFAYGVMREGFLAKNKFDLIERTARADMHNLGSQYWRSLRGYGEAGPYLIDKTPANYLYLGLIAKALPKARIIHVRRHPLASGYAMFKTLFRMGYPFSYALDDIGHYYLAYHRLMAHWRGLFGERILDIQYENLVDHQEAVSREIIDHCALQWEAACLDFHRNAAPTATASATQVRQPIYRSALDLWRHHEKALQPLRTILEAGGVSCA